MGLTGTYLEREKAIIVQNNRGIKDLPSLQLYHVEEPVGNGNLDGLVDGQYVVFEPTNKEGKLVAISIQPYDYKKPNNDSLLTVREVSQLLHLHSNTLRRWSDQGIIKAYRIGPRGDRRFRPEDVEALIARGLNNVNYNKNSQV
jgi:excisionase family DNA binding protein